jgi:hypothetical protein
MITRFLWDKLTYISLIAVINYALILSQHDVCQEITPFAAFVYKK